MMRTLRPVFIQFFERLTLAATGVAAALGLFLWLAHEVHGGETQRYDTTVHQYFQAQQQPVVHAFMAAVSMLASGWAISIVSLICFFALWRAPTDRRNATAMLLAAAGGQAVVYGLKALFHRARPEAAFASLGYSFPSGHAFAAVTLYGLFAYWLAQRALPPRRIGIWAGAVLLVLLIGFSRVYLGVHYASDVAAGFAAGLPWLWGCLALTSPPTARFNRKREQTL